LLALLPDLTREEVVTRADLGRATEAFLASTTREVQAIAAVDDVVLAAAPGPLTTLAATTFAEHVRAELAGA
jgi:branched-subunit amino acid aminotransferase/4-amino-4-deoxychorismate lyase